MSFLWNEQDESNATNKIIHQIKILELHNNKTNLEIYIKYLKISLSKSDYQNYERILYKFIQ